MANYKNWDSLMKAMQKEANKALQKKVAPIVEKKLQQNAESIAAGEFSRSSDGISDLSNIVSEMVDENTLLVKDIAEPQEPLWGTYNNSDGTIFSHWIDQGEWMELSEFITTGQKIKRPARQFVTKTQEDINVNPSEIIKALKDGMGIQ